MLRFLCLLVLSTVMADRATYPTYQVHRVVPVNQKQLEALQDLEASLNGLQFWLCASRIQKAVDIMVPPDMLPFFTEVLGVLNLTSDVYISNVQQLIDTERPKVRPKVDFGWTDYYTLEEVNDWLDSLVETYPGVVTPVVGGFSYEGRQIKGVKVSFKAGNPVVIFEGGIHAREWVTPATVTYILNKLLTSDNPVIQNLARSFDYYFFPIVNPDGYVYTHTTNRMWRKNRRPIANSLCYGVDLNRNWDFHWMEGGASNNSCSDTYAGESPFSEPETRSLADYFKSISDQLVAYLAFHSYSQLLMFPYGYTPEHVSNYDELMALGLEAASALAAYNGTQYKVGPVYTTIYQTSGESIDWVLGILGTPYSYTWELRDTGRYGFLLPANQIIGTAEEALNSVIVILQHAKNRLQNKTGSLIKKANKMIPTVQLPPIL